MEYYNKNDNIIKIILLILNTLNLILIDIKYNFIVTIILFIAYYNITKSPNKKKFILTWILFSINIILGESLFIYKTGLLNYTNPDIFNVPSWLFTAYGNMILSFILINNYVNI